MALESSLESSRFVWMPVALTESRIPAQLGGIIRRLTDSGQF
jgi:hypothetical protein